MVELADALDPGSVSYESDLSTLMDNTRNQAVY